MKYLLSRLTHDATIGELTSLEALITDFTSHGFIHRGVVEALWDIFTMSSNVSDVTTVESCGGLLILNMAANAEPALILERLSTIISVGLGPRWKVTKLFLKM